ncbi:MAG: flagellar hook-length control protein FliK [Planctomycetota bacterium]
MRLPTLVDGPVGTGRPVAAPAGSGGADGEFARRLDGAQERSGPETRRTERDRRADDRDGDGPVRSGDRSTRDETDEARAERPDGPERPRPERSDDSEEPDDARAAAELDDDADVDPSLVPALPVLPAPVDPRRAPGSGTATDEHIEPAAKLASGRPTVATGSESDGASDAPDAAVPAAAAEGDAPDATQDPADASPDARVEAKTERPEAQVRGHERVDVARVDGGTKHAAAAAPAPPEHSLHAENARAAEALEQIRLHVRPGMRSATIELSPKELGRVDVHVVLEKEGLVAHLRVEAPDTYRALERHMPELRAGLEQGGLDVVRLDLSMGQGERGADRERAEVTRSVVGPGRTNEGPASRVETIWLRPSTVSDDAVDVMA